MKGASSLLLRASRGLRRCGDAVFHVEHPGVPGAVFHVEQEQVPPPSAAFKGSVEVPGPLMLITALPSGGLPRFFQKRMGKGGA
jgi:hypothetical protein